MAAADPTQLKLAKQHSVKHIVFSISRVPNSTYIFYGASDAKVHEFDLATDKNPDRSFEGHEGYVTGVAFTGRHVVSGAYDGRLNWWNVETGEKEFSIAAHRKWIRNVVASPDLSMVASIADDMECKLWKGGTGELIRTLAGHAPITPHHYPSMLYAVGFSADNQHVATADKVGHVVIWNVSDGKQLATLEVPTMYTWDPRQRRHSIGGPRSVAFSPDGSLLAVGGTGQIGNIDHLEANERIEIFEWRTGKRIHELAGDKHKGLVEWLCFHPNGQWLIAAGGAQDGFLKFVDIATGKTVHQDKVPMHVYGCSLSETGDTIHVAGYEKLISYEFKATG